MAAGDLITSDGQIEWGGLLLGSGTAYRWSGDDDALTGWEDAPGLDRGSVPRPARHGSWAGRDYAQERVVSWKCMVGSGDVSEFGALVKALRRATAISDHDEDAPLVIRTRGGETLLAYGKIAQRFIPNNKAAGIGRGTASLQWICTDPRRYSVTEHSTLIPQPSAGSGLVYPITYPLDFGTAGDSGSRLVDNAGDAAASPVLTITGPCTTPAVIQVASGLRFELDLVLAAGESVVVDTGANTVLLGGVADRFFSMTAASVPPELFTLPLGETELAFRAAAYGGGAQCTVTWRDAYQ